MVGHAEPVGAEPGLALDLFYVRDRVGAAIADDDPRWAKLEADRWALSYFVLSLSAFKDPLTGAPIKLSAADRAAINDPALAANESHLAYRSQTDDRQGIYAGEAWAKKHGFDFLKLRPATEASAPGLR